MPQARLPDINIQFNRFVQVAVSEWRNKNYDACIGALVTLNGLLPKQYRVAFSTEGYRQKDKSELLIVCPACKKEFPKRLVPIVDILLSRLKQVITGKEFESCWHCTECKSLNRLDRSEFIQEKLENPSFLQVVPDPPQRRDGLQTRMNFHVKFTSWFWTTMSEIEKRMADFRDDNWQKKENYMDDSEYGEGAGEEDDI